MAKWNEPQVHTKHIRNEQEGIEFVERFSKTHDVIGYAINNLNADDIFIEVQWILSEEEQRAMEDAERLAEEGGAVTIDS